MYTMIQIDPDVPNPTAGTQERPILHGLVTNIVNGDVTTGIYVLGIGMSSKMKVCVVNLVNSQTCTKCHLRIQVIM